MRGSYEAFILVKVKDGREFVCALNRQVKKRDSSEKPSLKEQEEYLETMVIWN